VLDYSHGSRGRRLGYEVTSQTEAVQNPTVQIYIGCHTKEQPATHNGWQVEDFFSVCRTHRTVNTPSFPACSGMGGHPGAAREPPLIYLYSATLDRTSRIVASDFEDFLPLLYSTFENCKK